MIHIQSLIDDARCFATIRELRWPESIQCPACKSLEVGKRGFHTNQSAKVSVQSVKVAKVGSWVWGDRSPLGEIALGE